MLSTPVKIAASSRTQDSQFFRGLPLDLLPCLGIHYRRYLGTLSSGIRTTSCPNHLNLDALTNTSIGLMFALFSSSAFDTSSNFCSDTFSQTPLMEHCESLHLCLGSIPKLAAIKKYCEHSRFIDTDFSRCLDVATVPYTAKEVESS